MKKFFILFIACCALISVNAQNSKATVTVDTEHSQSTISKHIYGHFAEHLGSCIYGGIWVGEDSPIPNINGYRKELVDALKRLKIPNLRWPGGCFADEYHWMDGIGPRSQRPKMINTHWGGVTEDNSFGTHEFLDFCELIETEPYICGNVGSGTVEEMSKWVEYITFDGESPMANLRRQNGREKPWKVRFWGVGNENWGCGGNMTAEFYADQYRRYATYCRNYSGNRLFKIAGGPNVADYHWTEILMKNVGGRMMQGLSLLYYTVPRTWADKGSATVFDLDEYSVTMQKAFYMEELVTKHSNIMDRYDPQKRVALVVDEWGTWYNVEPGTNPGFLYQQNSLRDALLAAVNFNIFNNHSDRVRIANIAQMVNVLQAIILTKDDKLLLTPTYYAFEMYNRHHDASLLPTRFSAEEYVLGNDKIPSLSVSSSKNEAGEVTITVVNVDPVKSMDMTCVLRGGNYRSCEGTILTSGKVNDHNTFEKPMTVKPEIMSGLRVVNNEVKFTLPAKSIVCLVVK